MMFYGVGLGCKELMKKYEKERVGFFGWNWIIRLSGGD